MGLVRKGTKNVKFLLLLNFFPRTVIRNQLSVINNALFRRNQLIISIFIKLSLSTLASGTIRCLKVIAHILHSYTNHSKLIRVENQVMAKYLLRD